MGTEAVVNAMLATGLGSNLRKLSGSLGHTKTPITEDTPFEDGPLVTAYSLSKYKAELEVWRGSEEGLSVIIVNLCHYVKETFLKALANSSLKLIWIRYILLAPTALSPHTT